MQRNVRLSLIFTKKGEEFCGLLHMQIMFAALPFPRVEARSGCYEEQDCV